MKAPTLALTSIPNRVPRLRELPAWHPEWWTIAVSAAAWLTMALSTGNSFVPAICSSPSLDQIGMSVDRLRIRSISSELARESVAWLVMAVAMMLPATVVMVRHVAFRSFSWRRNRAVVGFLLGYLSVWAVTGAALMPILIAARAFDSSGGRLILAFGLLLAAAQLTPLKLRGLRGCHRNVPLYPAGWRADAACVRFGVGNGANCVVSCWGFMLAACLASRSLLAMVCFQAIVLYERYARRPRIEALACLAFTCAVILLFLPLDGLTRS